MFWKQQWADLLNHLSYSMQLTYKGTGLCLCQEVAAYIGDLDNLHSAFDTKNDSNSGILPVSMQCQLLSNSIYLKFQSQGTAAVRLQSVWRMLSDWPFFGWEKIRQQEK
jgi:hypothetical protein